MYLYFYLCCHRRYHNSFIKTLPAAFNSLTHSYIYIYIYIQIYHACKNHYCQSLTIKKKLICYSCASCNNNNSNNNNEYYYYYNNNSNKRSYTSYNIIATILNIKGDSSYILLCHYNIHAKTMIR